jgi:hypothetical protein
MSLKKRNLSRVLSHCDVEPILQADTTLRKRYTSRGSSAIATATLGDALPWRRTETVCEPLVW